MKRKGFTPILVLVLIALAIVGYFGYKNFKTSNQQSKYLTGVSPTPVQLNIDSRLKELKPTLIIDNFTPPKEWVRVSNKYEEVYVPEKWYCQTQESTIYCLESHPAPDGKDWDLTIDFEENFYNNVVNRISYSVAQELNVVPIYKPTIQKVNLPNGQVGLLVGNTHLIFEHNRLTYDIFFNASNDIQSKVISTFKFLK